MDLVEVLGFLFMISTMELGRVRHTSRNVARIISKAGIHDGASESNTAGSPGGYERLWSSLATKGKRVL
jgi:hypothetical protein